MRIPLPTVTRICDQFGVPDRSAAAVAMADPKSPSECPSKLKEQFVVPFLDFFLFFDSRKDRTLYNQKIASTFQRTVVIEEHISLLNESGSKYLRHVTPLSGSGESIAKSIITFPNETGLNPEGLLAVRCDGIAVNTKKKNSPLQFLELEFSRPLQWLIRQLHMNKLPLRHLFERETKQNSEVRAFEASPNSYGADGSTRLIN
ncbi:hypothetical protein ILUMI_12455 [Ignelater luminosus]|uniref:Uncharacterized protein n=1 Tax=Ignelater luminosus TaxID=2038154 RepID=A0A8K0CYJ2_IGNLU|nr:hypothetical protein ILUMI_12455 [Ignelater luminosus]